MLKLKRNVNSDNARRKVDGRIEAKIILVMDNLNTHRPASLYKAFKPEKARRILKRLAEAW